MQQPDALNLVAEFHNTFKHPILDTPQIPAFETGRAALRVSLLEEEVRELRQAVAQGDLVEVADALCDIQYVLAGAVLEFGLGDKFKALFEEVQRSNMSKAHDTEEEARHTGQLSGEPYSVELNEVTGKWVTFKGNGKVLKNVNYSPANLEAILEAEDEIGEEQEEFEFQVSDISEVLYVGTLKITARTKEEAIEKVKAIPLCDIDGMVEDWEQKLDSISTKVGTTEVHDGDTQII